MRKPPALRPKDLVRVIAPAGPFDRPGFEAGVKVIGERYRVVFEEGIFSSRRYLAGDDARRLAELEQAFADTEAKAVFAARGGYGAMRLLGKIRVESWPNKALVGFSDITALHCVLQRAGRISIHGPVLTQLGRAAKPVAERLFELLESPRAPEALTGARTLVPGAVEGPLLGGNLSVLTRLLGTPYLPSLQGAVLCLEDVGERPYRLDRMWTHLRLAGVFEQVAGIALGDFTGCEEKDGGYSSADVLAELAKETGKPCALGFPIGHEDRNVAVALGTRVRLDATQGRLEFLEGAVEGS
jgi:muramoyltetrapeptide carboxypeptidase